MSREARSISPAPRWSSEHAEKVISELEHSGLSVQAFAARNGLESERLYRWRARLKRVGGGRRDGTRSKVGFAEVGASGRRIAEHHAPSGDGFEIVLRSGHVIRVRPCFDEDALRRVLAILGED